jgi:hypothetical protein
VKWIGGLAEWQEGDTVFMSVAFTWKLDEAWQRAMFARSCGWKVRAGGPALFLVKMQHKLTDVAEVGGAIADAVTRHNPLATFASRGCDQKCGFCIVPQMEGDFTLLPDFTPRPILCDNNLSGLPAEYQDYIVRRYQEAGVKLLDANSGFEPHTFDDAVYARWASLVNAGRGPWRFAYDTTDEGPEVRRVMRMLADEPAKRKRVYVLIGNEPKAMCMQRIQEVIDGGCEPHVQPYMKLVAMSREPMDRYDWTAQEQKNVARWANGFLWKQMPFNEYDRFAKKKPERYDESAGLFV